MAANGLQALRQGNVFKRIGLTESSLADKHKLATALKNDLAQRHCRKCILADIGHRARDTDRDETSIEKSIITDGFKLAFRLKGHRMQRGIDKCAVIDLCDSRRNRYVRKRRIGKCACRDR